jgi:hypothetical protein
MNHEFCERLRKSLLNDLNNYDMDINFMYKIMSTKKCDQYYNLKKIRQSFAKDINKFCNPESKDINKCRSFCKYIIMRDRSTIKNILTAHNQIYHNVGLYMRH